MQLGVEAGVGKANAVEAGGLGKKWRAADANAEGRLKGRGTNDTRDDCQMTGGIYSRIMCGARIPRSPSYFQLATEDSVDVYIHLIRFALHTSAAPESQFGRRPLGRYVHMPRGGGPR